MGTHSRAKAPERKHTKIAPVDHLKRYAVMAIDLNNPLLSEVIRIYNTEASAQALIELLTNEENEMGLNVGGNAWHYKISRTEQPEAFD